MNYSFYLKNIILNDNINVCGFDSKVLYQWLVSNFVNILSDQKIFISSVTLTPLEDPSYKFLCKIEAFDDKTVYKVEYGELINLNAINEHIIPSDCQRLVIVNFNEFNPSLFKFVSLDFVILHNKERNTLIIY